MNIKMWNKKRNLESKIKSFILSEFKINKLNKIKEYLEKLKYIPYKEYIFNIIDYNFIDNILNLKIENKETMRLKEKLKDNNLLKNIGFINIVWLEIINCFIFFINNNIYFNNWNLENIFIDDQNNIKICLFMENFNFKLIENKNLQKLGHLLYEVVYGKKWKYKNEIFVFDNNLIKISDDAINLIKSLVNSNNLELNNILNNKWYTKNLKINSKKIIINSQNKSNEISEINNNSSSFSNKFIINGLNNNSIDNLNNIINKDIFYGLSENVDENFINSDFDLNNNIEDNLIINNTNESLFKDSINKENYEEYENNINYNFDENKEDEKKNNLFENIEDNRNFYKNKENNNNHKKINNYFDENKEDEKNNNLFENIEDNRNFYKNKENNNNHKKINNYFDENNKNNYKENYNNSSSKYKDLNSISWNYTKNKENISNFLTDSSNLTYTKDSTQFNFLIEDEEIKNLKDKNFLKINKLKLYYNSKINNFFEWYKIMKNNFKYINENNFNQDILIELNKNFNDNDFLEEKLSIIKLLREDLLLY